MNGVNKELLFQYILDNIDIGISIINKEGKFIYYNKAMSEIEVLTEEEVIGQHVLDVYSGIDGETSTLMRCLNTKKPIHNKMERYLNKNGKELYSTITDIPIIENNEVIGVIEFCKNMEELGKVCRSFERWYNSIEYPIEDSMLNKEINTHTFNDFITKNIQLRDMLNKLKKMSMYDYNVLIYGETGTGKEIIAQSIHNGSKRWKKPFIAQNCAAIPENLLESIFFGTEKGSFTGALCRPGLFEEANGGTLLLDELNSLPMYLQAKLLRVLQEGYIRRLGSSVDKKVDVRVIATVNEKPEDLIKRNRLREDLFYRLGPIYVNIPPLRERKEDIEYLSKYFLRRESKKLNIITPDISKEVIDFFMKHSWKGNVRELKNVIKYMVLHGINEEVIKIEHIPYYLSDQMPEKLKLPESDKESTYNEKVIQFEKDLIKNTLIKTNRNISEASRILKIKRQTLQYKIKKWEIQ